MQLLQTLNINIGKSADNYNNHSFYERSKPLNFHTYLRNHYANISNFWW